MQVPQALIYDGCAWLGNVSTSVLIVFVNKVLMDPQKGYSFTFGASPVNTATYMNKKASNMCSESPGTELPPSPLPCSRCVPAPPCSCALCSHNTLRISLPLSSSLCQHFPVPWLGQQSSTVLERWVVALWV